MTILQPSIEKTEALLQAINDHDVNLVSILLRDDSEAFIN
jgi:hypothetical protein